MDSFKIAVFVSILCYAHGSHFHFSDCMPNGKSNPDNVIHVNSAHLAPDEVMLEADLGFQVNVDVLKNVSGGLALDLSVHRKVLGVWVPIPCVSEVGSCHYPDACALLNKGFVHNSQVQCPHQLSDESFPCTCPFRAGDYTLTSAHFDIPKLAGIWSILGTGDYQVEGHLTDTATGRRVGCHNMAVTLTKACSFFDCLFG